MKININLHGLREKKYIIAIFIFSVFAVFCYGNADYDNYKLIYNFYAKNNVVNNGIVDSGFMQLCKLFVNSGMTFEVFRGLYIFIALCILVNAVAYFNENKKTTYLLYLLFPFALDIAQMRHLMAVSIVLYGLRYLEKKQILKYCLFVVIASTQQISAIVYLLFILALVRKEKTFRYIIIASVAEYLVILVFSRYILQAFVSRFIHFSVYSSFTSYSIRLSLLYMIMAIGIAVYSNFFMLRDFNDDRKMFLNSVVLCSVLFVPLILINENMARIYRGVVVLIYSRLLVKSEKNQINIKNIIPLIICAILFYIHLSPHNINHWERVVKPIFDNNYFFELFR